MDDGVRTGDSSGYGALPGGPAPGSMDPLGAPWRRADVRAALRSRDVPALYRLLIEFGASEADIAERTGQPVAEVSAVLAGRPVTSYDALARLADGLGIPRGLLGMAGTDPGTGQPVTAPDTEEDDVDRRDFLALALGLTVGAGATPLDFARVDPIRTPAPARVGAGEITQLRTVTGTLSALDRRHGARAVRDAVLAQLRWAEDLCGADLRPESARALHGALAELRSLAGWTSHDVGLDQQAKEYLLAALGSARTAGDSLRVISVLHRLGCVHLADGDPGTALRFFQLGHLSSADSGSGSATALLYGHEAKAYADLGQVRQALASLHRAEDAFGTVSTRPDPGAGLADSPVAPPLLDRGGLDNLAGRVLAALSTHDHTHLDLAVDRLHRSATADLAARARRRTLTLNRLAVTCLRHGAVADGARYGEQAVESTQGVQSQRVALKLAGLRSEALRHPSRPEARSLADQIGALARAA